MGLIVWGIDVGAFCLAVAVLPGFHAPANVLQLVCVAAVFATMSILLRPISWALTLPLLLVTVLPALLALNALFLALTAWIAQAVGVPFAVDSGPWIWLGTIGIGGVRYVAQEGLHAAGRWRASCRNQSMIRGLERTMAHLERERDVWRKLVEAREPMLEHPEFSTCTSAADVAAHTESDVAEVAASPS